MHVRGNGSVTSSATGFIIAKQRQCKEWYHLNQNSGTELTYHSKNGSEKSGVAGLTVIQGARTAVHQNSPQHG